jgi:DNA-binding Lrp family transcriptional regulator
MKRLPGPSDDAMLAIIKDGPIDSWLLAERLGCTTKMAASRCKNLEKSGIIKMFVHRIYKRDASSSERANVWYIPGCGIPPCDYQAQVRAARAPSPRKTTIQTLTVGINSDDLEWMDQARANAERKRAQRKAMRG